MRWLFWAINKMTSTVRLLCLFLCCWYVDETLGTNPGLKIRLSQPGLNYAARVAVQKLSAKVQGASLPDQSGQSHTPVGKVKYEVKNMHVGIIRHVFLKVKVTCSGGSRPGPGRGGVARLPHFLSRPPVFFTDYTYYSSPTRRSGARPPRVFWLEPPLVTCMALYSRPIAPFVTGVQVWITQFYLLTIEGRSVNKTILKPRLVAATGGQYIGPTGGKIMGFSRRRPTKIPRCSAYNIG